MVRSVFRWMCAYWKTSAACTRDAALCLGFGVYKGLGFRARGPTSMQQRWCYLRPKHASQQCTYAQTDLMPEVELQTLKSSAPTTSTKSYPTLNPKPQSLRKGSSPFSAGIIPSLGSSAYVLFG